jgi:O-antigen/teichoic acid export membrane protein
MSVLARGRAFVLMFSSAVAAQAVLSATSLVVGLILVRRTSDVDYGFYVLTVLVVMLTTATQNSFIQPQVVLRMTSADVAGRADLIGGLYREQRMLWPVFALVATATALALWWSGHLTDRALGVALVGSLAVIAAMFREFFRMMLMNYRRSGVVFGADLVYAALLITGVMAATFTRWPALVAVCSLGAAALSGGLVCYVSLRRMEPWNIHGERGILLSLVPSGVWTTAGSVTHWLFSQGFNFLIAGMLGVAAVAAVAATRILIMPVNLLSTGIGTLLYPTVAGWLTRHSVKKVLNRQLLIAGSLALAAVCYFALIWLMRDWLFLHVLKKQVPNRDRLLMLWFAVGILMLLRDQVVFVLLSRSRFRILTVLTVFSAVVALTTSVLAMRVFGVSGALLGVLCGEVVNVSGLILLSVLESRGAAVLPA